MLAYIGSIFMIVFSFTMSLPLAIIGLTILTIQALKLRAFNLVVLNIFSICGFAWRLIS